MPLGLWWCRRWRSSLCNGSIPALPHPAVTAVPQPPPHAQPRASPLLTISSPQPRGMANPSLRGQRLRTLTSSSSQGSSSSPTSSVTPAGGSGNRPVEEKAAAAETVGLVEPTKPVNVSDWKRLLGLARPEAKVLAGATSLLFVSSAVTMAVPFSMGRIIDLVISSLGVETATPAPFGLTPDSLPLVFGLLGCVFAVGAIANFGRVVLMKIAGERIILRLRTEMFKNIIRQDVTFFDKNRTGELISRLSADTVVVGKSLTNNISDGLRSSVSAIVGLGMMIYMNVELTMIMMSIVPPIAIGGIYYGRLVRRLSEKTQEAIGETTKVAEEKVGNIRTVRSFAQEVAEAKKYEKKSHEVYSLSIREGFASGAFFGGAGFSGNLVMLAILFYGGRLVQTGALSTGDLASFFMYTAYVGFSFTGLSGFYSEFMKGLGASSRLFSLLESKSHIESLEDGVILPKTEGAIEFKGLSFTYPTRPDTPVFRDLTFSVRPGTNVAIVGSSGSGKSTIAQLLLRFYDPEKGAIFVDGYDLRSLDPTHLRNNMIAFVSQEPVLFAASIRENISYGRPQATEEEILKAADIANARDFIEGFPDGLDTFAGEKGKQRIAIARAVLKDPKILILDEATSALDAASEYLVQDAISKIVRGRTVITIAHRLSTIQQADHILMIQDGQVVEEGAYEELIRKPDGRFKKLIEAQLSQ
ncbi:P-loop containing nucleoside triphosphate hydrolase protein [Zopfochytrium polystomum]|nr:P-loop containing nucleoside triphosphate hydrolase protein [Zopfochytrium polystomum]